MEKKYDYKNFNDLTDDKIFNIDLSWMHNLQLYDKISQDVIDRYNKDKKSNELKSIQTFLDNITNEYIKNKKDALEEFKTIKNNVNSENFKVIAKELELTVFGYDDDGDHDDDDDDDEEPKYEENKKGYDGAGYDKWEFNKDGFNKDGYDKWGFNEDGFNEDGYNDLGFNKDGFNKNGYDNWGFNEDGKKSKKYNKFGYNINGIDRQGFNRDRYKINGYSNSGYDRDYYNINGYNSGEYDRDRYNINGYNSRSLNRKGNKRKALKKNIPGSGLKILTPQQMLARLPILLAQVQAGNNSRELKNEIRQLLYSLYRSKQISKTVYKSLIATI